ncbi:MAG: type II toxin-antitoxin system VapC family toxin [Thermoleophilaceae bacterium]
MDTTVFVYAVGRDHPHREPCRRLIERIERGELDGDASVEVVHEFAHVRLRRTADRAASLREARAVAALCRLHDLERRDLELGLELVERQGLADVRDGLHAATALNRGIDLVVSADRDFDAVDGLVRVDPADAAAVERLAG